MLYQKQFIIFSFAKINIITHLPGYKCANYALLEIIPSDIDSKQIQE